MAPPIVETQQSYYEVQGVGPIDLTFRFHQDDGSFLFNFGYYHLSPALAAIDVSTEAGKIAYATQALAPGNAFLVFDDSVHNAGATATHSVTGGSTLGFFLIPDETLQNFQDDPGDFAVNGVGTDRLGASGLRRWPLFSFSDANPGDMDQLMSFSGTSDATNNPSNMFAWEDLTRAAIQYNPNLSDNDFNDLIFGIEGVEPVPEPGSRGLAAMGLAAAVGLYRRRTFRRR